MSEISIDDLLDISLKAGALVLENGGETYRAEETCVHVARALGAAEASAFVTPTVVVVSASGKDGGCHTAMRRITARTVSLSKIARLDGLTRRLVRRGKRTEPRQAERLLERIRRSPGHRAFPLVVMAAFGAFFFSLMLSGGLRESAVALAVGGMLRVVLILLGRARTNGFIVSVISGAVVSTLCEAVLELGLAASSVTIMTAALMQVVPGMAVVNAIRDLIAGDLMAGAARLVEAFVVAAGLSVGSAFGMLVFSNARA